MSTRLIDRIKKAKGAPAPARATHSPELWQYKRELHARLIETLDLSAIQNRSREELEPELRVTLLALMEGRELPLGPKEREHLALEILDELLGLGPLEPLLRLPNVSDILINGPDLIFVERGGTLEEADARFHDDEHLMRIINRIVSQVGRRVDESNPMVDARLRDGSRFNAIIPPLALDGAMVSIRRFGRDPITRSDLIRFGSVPEELMKVLEACVAARLNVLVSGGTGTGKTTLLNVLSSFIGPRERVITIEDAAELQLQQRHVVRLETRPANIEGQGEVTCRDLVRNALRMRPDRIIVGEIRGDEAVDMLQAMNTGHEGSICTIHANSPRHALRRLETMVGLGLGNISDRAIREMIGDALDVIIQISRLQDGSRRVSSITEVTGMEGIVISTQELFTFRQRTIEPDGRVRGTFSGGGLRPHFAAKLVAYGIKLSPEIYRFRMDV